MRIAQIAPLYESCPPKTYGGTERIVSYLTEELVRQGHEVTLFASGDSTTRARLIAPIERAIRLNANARDPLLWHYVMLQKLAQMADEFDVLHFHTDYLHYPQFHDSGHCYVTTLHGRLDLIGLPEVYRAFPNHKLISISDGQRKYLPWANWVGTVYHGLPRHFYDLGTGGGGYLAFIGRFADEKRPEYAIEIAKRVGMKIKLAAKVDKVDVAYFERVVRPLLDHPLVEYIGEIDEHQKREFLGNAAALLFPIDWPEPFGLVTIEAMANGTPVIAFNRGSVTEIIDEGVTGFVVDTIDQAVATVDRALALDRARIRAVFEQRFSVERMAQDYLSFYQSLRPRFTPTIVPRDDEPDVAQPMTAG
jgi:glycosyltransferase involved in cell wall biosynthesis